ncbi:MAG: glycosyltransferase family 39 protein [Candidatus Nealsonbacteria bacterium]
MKKDSLTFDELAHIPAGYSYLTKQDYRVNPEHPPLLKDIAAIPLTFLHLNFPSQDQTWLQENSAPAWWVQFDLGTKLIYQSGNNPKDIIFWARLPMILIMLLLGWLIFKWTRELAGNKTALAVLIIFCFSPTILANGRLVTTDVGAAFGAVIATYFWLKFLYKPRLSNIILASLFFGIAMICKFSLILLIPFFGIITIIYSLLFSEPKKKIKNLSIYLIKALVIGFMALIFIIGPVYQFHIQNYPVEQQKRDTISDLSPGELKTLKQLDVWMVDQPVLRPFSQYFRGVLMAGQRTIFGNTVYFLGEVSSSAWWYYFPIIFLLKIPLAFSLMSLMVLLGLTFLIFKHGLSVKRWIKENFTIFSFLIFIGIYWGTAIFSNLNIGIRHLLPTIPFIFMIVIIGLKSIIQASGGKTKKFLILTSVILFVWYIFSSLMAFPYYISYYNELAEGSENGYKYAVDSNYDWGQDFYRLLAFVETNNIDKIYLDYFGGENPEYWLGEKYVQLKPREIKEAPKGWVAVSLNQMQGGVGEPVPGFDQETGFYDWLKNYTPVARMGYSIFVYKIE